MEKPQGTSFIPKSPVKGTVKPRGVRKVYILTYVTYVLFFGTLISAAGLFVYGLTIEQQLVSEKNRLADERKSFKEADLERVRDLEVRMNTAFSVLDRQVSVHSIFEALERSTVKPIQIEGLEYVKDIDNSLNVTLRAVTEIFNSALFQREIFASDSVLAGASFSEVSFSSTESETDLPLESSEELRFTLDKKFNAADIPYVVTDRNTATTFSESFEDLDTTFVEDALVSASSTRTGESEVTDVVN